ncbi:MAG: LysR family transcriptional regulator [Agarilytica sp.]
MVDLNDMVIFAKVAELHGISPAARALKMPKSKVSRRMAALENELEVRLLERSTRSMHVTEAGNLYLQHCRRVVEEVSSAQESINNLSDSPRGHLRIGTSTAIGQYLIAPHLGEFMQQYPEIDTAMDLNNRRVDLISEGFDLVVRVGKLSDSNLVSKRLGSARAGLYAAPSYIKSHDKINRLEELQDHNTLVMSDANHSTQWLFEDGKGNSESIAITPMVSINDFHALRNIAAGGGGIANIPHYLVEDLVSNGQLLHILPEWQSPEIHYYVLYPSQLGLTRKARVWIDFITEKLRQTSLSSAH